MLHISEHSPYIALFLQTTEIAHSLDLKIAGNVSAVCVRHESLDRSAPPVATVAVVTPKLRKLNKDEHSTNCDVCNSGGGGDLMYCDTCPLSFHTKCIRPQLLTPPKAAWSCPQCVAAGISAPNSSSEFIVPTGSALVGAQGSGTAGCAEVGIFMKTKRTSRGREGAAEEEGTDAAVAFAAFGVGNGNGSCSPRLSSKIHELTVSRSGKRFVVRKTAKSQIVELDRCGTLEEALVCVAAELNPISSKKNKSSGAEKDELWCAHCLDDPSVMLCAFCGCRRCYGKHDSDKLLVCDGCEEEWHMSCLPKPIESIPDAAWFCTRCCNLGLNKVRKQQDREREILNSTASVSSKLSKAALREVAAQQLKEREQKEAVKLSPGRPAKTVAVPGRGRGRPPGSSKKAKEALVSAATAAAFAQGYPVDAATLALLMEHNAQYAFRGSGVGGVGVIGDLDLSTGEHIQLPPVLGAPGYDEAMKILNGFPRLGCSVFHATEKEMFSQMRTWAPLGDLELTRDALAQQCDSIHKRIRLHDPFFQYKGMSSILGEPRHSLDYEEDEDGMTDIANTDDLIDNDFELDAGNAAMAAEAERELSSSTGSHSPQSRSDEEVDVRRDMGKMSNLDGDGFHSTVSTDSLSSSSGSSYHHNSSYYRDDVGVGLPLESQLVGTELLFIE